MPDSLRPPPSWGIPSYDERDLDTLMSGEVTDIPVALRPLAETLTALKGPPTLAELRGEATIMTEFRALAEFGPSGSAHPGGRAETLELPVPQPSGRHRVRRSANRRRGALLAAAVAAAIVVTITFTGNLPGPIHLPSASHLAASSAAAKPTSPNLQDKSASSVRAVPHDNGERPSPSPSPSAGVSSNASRLCSTFFWSFQHQVNGQQWRELPAYGQLSMEAGGSSHILSFCQPYLKVMFPHGMPVDLRGPFGIGQSGQGSQGSQGGDTAPGQNAHYPAPQGGF